VPSVEHPEGWLSIDLKEGAEEWAKRFREERDKQYGNIFSEEETDRRWTGDLGERVFDRWLKHQRVHGYQWIQQGAAGAPDFILPNGTRVGVKTVKRKVPPEPKFTAQITAKHAHEPTEQFFFMSYEFRIRRMWMLGGIDKPTFLEQAIYYPAGAQVHPNYTIREGHEIYNIDIDKLIAPMAWLGSMLGGKR
jgi:hypothetical protein